MFFLFIHLDILLFDISVMGEHGLINSRILKLLDSLNGTDF